MIIDATFWVAVSFFIFVGALIYLKIPQKINSSLTGKIDDVGAPIRETSGNSYRVGIEIDSQNDLSTRHTQRH